MPTTPTIGFQELAESREFAEFFTLARNVTGILVALVDPGGLQVKRLFPPGGENRICRLIQTTTRGMAACQDTDRRHCERAARERHGLYYRCHAGMVDMAVPIFIGGRHIATINCGQVLATPPSPEGLRQMVLRGQELGIDPALMREAYRHAPYVTPAQLNGAMQLFSFFAQYFCEVGARLHQAEAGQRADIAQARHYLQQHFREPMSLPLIAEQTGLSPTYFCTLFKQETGATVTDYLQRLRIDEAKRLLHATSHTVTEIALQVGFNNLTHFTRVFRQHEGCTPGAYRSQGNRP